MKYALKNNAQGYALPLALILVAVFSIVIASIGPRSNLFNETQRPIISKFKNDEFNYCKQIAPAKLDCPSPN